MLVDLCLGSRTAWKILLVLAEAPGKAVTRKELREFTKAGNRVLMQFLGVLEKFDIVLVGKAGREWTYRMNLSSPYAEEILGILKKEKRELNNLELPVASVLREFAHCLLTADYGNLSNIYLFGSYAKRTYAKRSDVDLAIITEKKDPNLELVAADMSEKLRRRFGLELQPHFFTKEEFERLKKSGHKLVRDIVKDGIRLI